MKVVMPETKCRAALNQGTSAAEKAASDGPVIITERGKPAHVLLTFEAYQKLAGKQQSLADLLYMPGLADIELEIPARVDMGRPQTSLDVLLDTNVISEMRKLRRGRIDANVARWSKAVNARELHIATITLYELQLGLLGVERRNPQQAAPLQRWL